MAGQSEGLRIAQHPSRSRSGAPGPIGAWGDLQALLTQHLADRLDPTPGGVLLVDETEDQRARGSSSLAKKIEAALRISLASRRSRTSALSRLVSSSSAVVGPDRSPRST